MLYFRYMLIIIISFTCIIFSNPDAHSDEDSTTTTIKSIVIESAGIGSQFDAEVNDISNLVTKGDFKSAKDKILITLSKFQELLLEDDIIYVSVASDLQYETFVLENPDRKVRRASWELQKLLFLKAFIAVEENDLDAALSTLDSLLKFAPYSSTALCEQGYLYNRLGQYNDSLASYQRAAEISNKFPTEKHNLAIALRGAGYSLTKLKKYDQALKAYTASLKYDSDNAIAQNGIATLNNLLEQ